MRCLTEKLRFSGRYVRLGKIFLIKRMVISLHKLVSDRKRKAIRSVVLVLAAMFIWACAGKEAAKDDPEAQFQLAEEAFNDEHYLLALDRYREIKNRFPYHSRATDSDLRIADTYFAQESYIEAASAYEIFKELHPANPKSDYVQYQIAMSFYNQVPSSSARDLGAAYRAIDAFEVLRQRYPRSEYSIKAGNLILECRHKLAEHEEYVADFYFRRNHYLSASYRYTALLSEFSKMGYDEEALYRLGISYKNIRMSENAKDAFNRLLQEYPKTSYKSEVLAQLKEIENKRQ